MVSFIITARDKTKREKYIQDYAVQHNIDHFDITTIDNETESKTTQSIGIDTVKIVRNKLFLKPIKSEYKVLIIEDAHLLTPQAQNALLKLLEEPPEHTFIFLGSDTHEALLPTIRSRCQMIILEEKRAELPDKEVKKITHFIEQLPTLSIEQKLKHAEQLAKDKDKAIIWLEKLILVLREKTISGYSSSEDNNPNREVKEDVVLDSARTITRVNSLRSFQSLQTTLKTTNVNPRFAIEHTLLSL